MIMNRFVTVALASTLALGISVGAMGADVIVLKAGHSQNAGEPMDLGLKMIGEHLEKATDGRARLEVFPKKPLLQLIQLLMLLLVANGLQ